MATKKARILVASLPRAYLRLFAILPGHELSFVRTLSEAQVALERDHFNMVMIGVHFDESRMFELLRYVRADKRYASVPVVCFRGGASEDAKSMDVEAKCEAACKAMDTAYFDLTSFADDSQGNAAVRKLVYDMLGSIE